MNVADLQKRLGVEPDNRLGPVTYGALFAYVANRDLGEVGRDLGVGAAHNFPAYEIVTPLRLAHFLGQTCHESGGYRYLSEIWGPTAAQSRYEGRLDLGNTQAGDGSLYRGRGIIQCTGRANYRSCGNRIHIPLEDNPKLAARPDIAVLIACDYWKAKNINQWADRGDVLAVSRIVNCGNAQSEHTPNGLDQRRALTERARSFLLDQAA